MSNFFNQLVSNFTPKAQPKKTRRRTNRTRKQAQQVRAANLRDAKQASTAKRVAPKKKSSVASVPPKQPQDRIKISRRRSRSTVDRKKAAERGKKFWNDVGQTLQSGITTVGDAGGKLIEGVADFGGKALTLQTKATGAVVGTGLKASAEVASGALELAGAPKSASRIRKTGYQAAKLIDANTKKSAQLTEDFVSGVGDGAGDVVSSVATAIANPVDTGKGLVELASLGSPVALGVELAQGKSLQEIAKKRQNFAKGIVQGFKDEYSKTGEDHGTAGQVGRAAFDVFSTVLSGGSTGAARGGLRATLNGVGDVGRASRAISRGEDVLKVRRGSGIGFDPALENVKPAPRLKTTPDGLKEYTPESVSRAPGKVGEFLGRQIRDNTPLKPTAERLSKLADSAAEFASKRQLSKEASALAKGKKRLEKGLGPGEEGARLLTPSRKSVNGLKKRFDELNENWSGMEAGKLDDVMKQMSESDRGRVRELRLKGLENEALEATRLGLAKSVVRDSLEVAKKLDEQYPFQTPKGVDPSNILAKGRREALEFLLNDSNISSDALRRNARHIIGDSDVTGPVFIQKFSQGDKVGRAFSASAGRESGAKGGSFAVGGYYGEASDALRSRRQIQSRNAVSVDNHADKFALYEIPQDTYAVASRVGEQYGKYGGHAKGGGLQYTFGGIEMKTPSRISDVGRLSASQEKWKGATISGLDFEEMRQSAQEVEQSGSPDWREVLGLGGGSSEGR